VRISARFMVGEECVGRQWIDIQTAKSRKEESSVYAIRMLVDSTFRMSRRIKVNSTFRMSRRIKVIKLMLLPDETQ